MSAPRRYVIVPGRLRKLFRGERRPVSSATGNTGTPSTLYSPAKPALSGARSPWGTRLGTDPPQGTGAALAIHDDQPVSLRHRAPDGNAAQLTLGGNDRALKEHDSIQRLEHGFMLGNDEHRLVGKIAFHDDLLAQHPARQEPMNARPDLREGHDLASTERHDAQAGQQQKHGHAIEQHGE